MKKIIVVSAVVAMSLFGSAVDDGQMLISQKKYTQAINTLKPLALKGDLRANYLLGKAYFDRALTYTDYKLAKKYFEISNYPKANLYLGEMYEKGLGVKKDIQKAIHYLQKSNSPEGNYLLFKIYSTGKDTIKDVKAALNYLKESAKAGYAKAQYSLGKLYLTNNEIVDRNLNKASKWLKEASEEGYTKSKELWNKYRLWKFENK